MKLHPSLFTLLIGLALSMGSQSIGAAAPFVQVKIDETFTDNVFLTNQNAKDDSITTLSLWYRQPLREAKHSRLRLKLDAKAFHWARDSFDNALYGLVGLDYRLQTGRKCDQREVNLDYGYVINDSLDFEAPFHRFTGHRFSAEYRWPVGDTMTASLGYGFTTRDWEAGVENRDGHNHRIQAGVTLPFGRQNQVELVTKWDQEKTDDPTFEYRRLRIGGALTHRFGAKPVKGAELSLGYEYGARDYFRTIREDHKNRFSIDLSVPIGRENTVQAGWETTDNNSTEVSHEYTQNLASVSLLHKF